jgi:hypothetical protein
MPRNLTPSAVTFARNGDARNDEIGRGDTVNDDE